MNIHKTVRLLTLTGAAAMVPGLVAAGIPVYGGWTATTGDIDGTGAGCPAGFTCIASVAGNGFLQQTVDDGTDSYIRTIIVETGVTGAATALLYTDENYIKTGNAGNGILGKQTMNTDISSSATFATGWAAGAGADVVITQSSSTGSGATLFESSFVANMDIDASGNKLGQTMAIKQSAFLNGIATSDAQKFMIQQESGTLLSITGGATTADSVTLDDGITGTNDTVTFDGTAASSDVMVVWIGQEVTLDATLGAPKFSYQSFTDRASVATDGTDVADVNSLSDYVAVNWGPSSMLENIFGTAPDFSTFAVP